MIEFPHDNVNFLTSKAVSLEHVISQQKTTTVLIISEWYQVLISLTILSNFILRQNQRPVFQTPRNIYSQMKNVIQTLADFSNYTRYTDGRRLAKNDFSIVTKTISGIPKKKASGSRISTNTENFPTSTNNYQGPGISPNLENVLTSTNSCRAKPIVSGLELRIQIKKNYHLCL